MKEGNSSKKWFQLANYRCTLDASVRQNLSSYEADSQDSIRCVKNDPIQCEIYCKIISERVGFQIQWFWHLGHITWFTVWFPSSTEEICTVTFSVCCSTQMAFLFNSLCSIKVNDLLTQQSKRIGKRPNVNRLHNFNEKALSTTSFSVLNERDII